MTLHDRNSPPALVGKRFVLATDLDGTFLGGSANDRRALYDWIEDNRSTVGLVFVTGRDPGFIKDLCHNQGVPMPEYVIGDVGTTIAHVTDSGEIDPIRELEHDIAAIWNDSGARVRAALDGKPGLTLQPVDFRYRVSYDYDPETFEPDTHDLIQSMGLDTLVSADEFFDVLPRGISKGPSLMKFINHFGLDPARCLAAGDTMNDLSMLKMGIPAVVVGGAEDALVREIGHMDHVFTARAIGAAGITEAVQALNLHPIA